MDETMRWSFADVWNESVLLKPERVVAPRDHMWASELGGPFIDRYLKLKGVTPTNAPGVRSLRKFDAGNIWEWIVGVILKRAGILIDEQKWLSYQYPGMLQVTGRLDFLAGGKPDWVKSKADIQDLDLPEFIKIKANAIIDYFSQKYPNGLDEIILEIKSAALASFDRYASTRTPEPKHKLQAFHYLKAKAMPEAHIVYVCKDDARVAEFAVFNDAATEAIYKKDIEEMSRYYFKDEQPPLEKAILFNEGRFRKNWKIGYSPYLTKLYGFKDTFEYDTKFNKRITQWNRVLARAANGDAMTDLNKVIIDDIKMMFANFDDLVAEAKKFKLETSLVASLDEGGETIL
jgi:hypothetical protein